MLGSLGCCLVGFLVRVFSLTCLLIGYRVLWGFPGYAVVKNPPASAGDARDGGSIPGCTINFCSINPVTELLIS